MTALNFETIKPVIDFALNEDIGSGDVTTNSIIPGDLNTRATMTAKADGVVAGLDVAEYVFKTLNPAIEWNPFVKDGDRVTKGALIVEV